MRHTRMQTSRRAKVHASERGVRSRLLDVSSPAPIPGCGASGARPKNRKSSSGAMHNGVGRTTVKGGGRSSLPLGDTMKRKKQQCSETRTVAQLAKLTGKRWRDSGRALVAFASCQCLLCKHLQHLHLPGIHGALLRVAPDLCTRALVDGAVSLPLALLPLCARCVSGCPRPSPVCAHHGGRHELHRALHRGVQQGRRDE
jgi:hypothetical protein